MLNRWEGRFREGDTTLRKKRREDVDRKGRRETKI